MEVKRQQNTPNFQKKEHFLPPDKYTGVKNVHFSEDLAYFVFLLPPF